MFIARQPIFDDNLEVYGYELLFRSSADGKKFDGCSSLASTATVLAASYEDGIEQISDGKKVFINFDENFIKNYNPELLSPDYLVIEILENTKIDDELIKRIVELKKLGYKIALDDFEKIYEDYPISKYANIIKYDLLLTPIEKLKYLVKKPLLDNKILLAEKVETEEAYLKAKKLGFKLFQGFFFSKPKIISKSVSKKESKIQYVRILSELKKEAPSYQSIAEIVEKDVNLSYRLMKSINAKVGKEGVYSIKKALTYLGLKELEQWVSIMMVQDFGKDKSEELIKISLLRSKFAEHLSLISNYKDKKFEASLMGLFSTIDALLDQDMENALIDIPLPEEIKDILQDNKNKSICINLKCIHNIITAYEIGDWHEVERISNIMNMKKEDIAKAYLDAIKWTNEVLESLGS